MKNPKSNIYLRYTLFSQPLSPTLHTYIVAYVYHGRYIAHTKAVTRVIVFQYESCLIQDSTTHLITISKRPYN